LGGGNCVLTHKEVINNYKQHIYGAFLTTEEINNSLKMKKLASFQKKLFLLGLNISGIVKEKGFMTVPLQIEVY